MVRRLAIFSYEGAAEEIWRFHLTDSRKRVVPVPRSWNSQATPSCVEGGRERDENGIDAD
jgi:hypothetical protein